MLNKIFDPQNAFWQFVGKAPHVLILSICWFVMCIPIVTIVPATIALYDAVARHLRPDVPGLYKRFFKTFVKELGRGAILSILWAIFTYFLLYGFGAIVLQAEVDPSLETWSLVYQVSLMIPVGLFLWTVTLESRFVYGFFELVKNSITFFFGYLPYTLAIVIISVACVLACYFVIPLLFFMPAIMMLLISFPVEKLFKKLIAKREAAENPQPEEASE